jgi:hypothetical protein
MTTLCNIFIASPFTFGMIKKLHTYPHVTTVCSKLLHAVQGLQIELDGSTKSCRFLLIIVPVTRCLCIDFRVIFFCLYVYQYVVFQPVCVHFVLVDLKLEEFIVKKKKNPLIKCHLDIA